MTSYFVEPPGTWLNVPLLAVRGGPEAVLAACEEEGVWVGIWTARPHYDEVGRPLWKASVPPRPARAMRVGHRQLMIDTVRWETDREPHRMISTRDIHVMVDEPYGPVLFRAPILQAQAFGDGTFEVNFGEQPALDLTGL